MPAREAMSPRVKTIVAPVVAAITLATAAHAMRLLMLLLVLCSAAAPAEAGPIEDAVVAYQKGDYATALRLYRSLAEQGHAGAQYKLGVLYLVGHGVPKDNAAAMSWYRKAAEQGYAKAQIGLGRMYGNGMGVPEDHAAMVGWFRKAAEQGDAEGQFGLGSVYAGGRGVPQDYVLAHMWYNLAAAQYEEFWTAEAAKNREFVAAKMTPAQIAEAQKLAREWKPKPIR